jgi:hypothetical protein
VGVEGVELRVDGGPWQPARLGTAASADTWVQWTAQWDAEAGDHTLEARATDATGTPQTSDVADVLPDGATGYPRISVRVD